MKGAGGLKYLQGIGTLQFNVEWQYHMGVFRGEITSIYSAPFAR